MKKPLLIVFFFFLINSIQAQKFSYGIKAGVNLANLYSSNMPIEEMTATRTGFHAGALGELRFSNLFALETEVLYSQQGAKIEIDYIPIPPPEKLGYQSNEPSAPNEIIGGKSEYNYLNVPVLAKFYVYDGLNLFLGPQVSFLLSAKDKYDSGENEMDVNDLIDPMDFGLLGGLGYQLKIGLFFSASYYWGINNISYINYENVLGYDINIHQGVLQFSAGYKF